MRQLTGTFQVNKTMHSHFAERLLIQTTMQHGSMGKFLILRLPPLVVPRMSLVNSGYVA